MSLKIRKMHADGRTDGCEIQINVNGKSISADLAILFRVFRGSKVSSFKPTSSNSLSVLSEKSSHVPAF
jgi:hypothetical protein